MTKKKSNAISKGIAIILEQIFAIIMVISLFVCGAYISKFGGNIEVNKENNFLNTGMYVDLVGDEILSIMDNYIMYGEKFETDGVYNPDKIVYIMDYAENNSLNEVSRYENDIGYRLEDLVRWDQKGIVYTEVYIYQVTEDESENAVSSSQTTDTGISQDAVSIELPESDVMTVPVESLKENLEDPIAETQYLDDFGYTIEGVQELYKPIGENSLLDYINSHPSVNPSDTYYYLSRTINNVASEVYMYKQSKAIYNASNTNLRYIITNLDTNVSRTNTDMSVADIRNMDNYIEINTEEVSAQGTLSDLKSRFYNVNYNSHYTILVGVDTTFPVNDTIYQSKLDFEKWNPWFLTFLVGMLISAVGVFITIIYLTIKSGRSDDSNAIQLNFFDKIYTELFFIIIGIAFIAALTIFSSGYQVIGNDTIDIAIIAVAVFVCNGILLVGYLSLIRRIKANTLIKASITSSIIKGFELGIENSKITTKIILKYAAIVILNFILISSGGFGMLLVVILDIYIGFAISKEAVGRNNILEGAKKIAAGDLDYKIDTVVLKGEDIQLAEAINNIGGGLQNAVDESMKNERLKTDLITNVSHDIKTPLTSIINYVDLLKREQIQDTKIKSYIDVLDSKSQRLKNLTEDLVEASKISSGNITLEFSNINFNELILQTNGEFDEKFKAKNLEVITKIPERPVIIRADGRRIWRVIENLYNNIAKYAMENTRVYVDVHVINFTMYLSIKNISKYPLNIEASELTERFIRGDISRNTEGSGLGLSIAKNLTAAQKGTFDIYLDGDLFKVTVTFPIVIERMSKVLRDSNGKLGMNEYSNKLGSLNHLESILNMKSSFESGTSDRQEPQADQKDKEEKYVNTNRNPNRFLQRIRTLVKGFINK